MELSEVFIYVTRIYAVNYFGSLFMVFSNIPVTYVRCFQVIMYIISAVYLCFAIYHKYKNYKIEKEIKKIKKKQLEDSNKFIFKRDYTEK